MTPSAANKRSIVIVVVGFAGTTLARALHQGPPDSYEESYTTFNPLLPLEVQEELVAQAETAVFSEIPAQAG